MKTQPQQLPTSIILFKPCLDFVLSGLYFDSPYSYDAGGNYFFERSCKFYSSSLSRQGLWVRFGLDLIAKHYQQNCEKSTIDFFAAINIYLCDFWVGIVYLVMANLGDRRCCHLSHGFSFGISRQEHRHFSGKSAEYRSSSFYHHLHRLFCFCLLASLVAGYCPFFGVTGSLFIIQARFANSWLQSKTIILDVSLSLSL